MTPKFCTATPISPVLTCEICILTFKLNNRGFYFTPYSPPPTKYEMC